MQPRWDLLPLLDNGGPVEAQAVPQKGAGWPLQSWLCCCSCCSAVSLVSISRGPPCVPSSAGPCSTPRRARHRSRCLLTGCLLQSASPRCLWERSSPSGRLKPAGGIVSVALPQGGGDARIDQILVDEGDIVAEGAVLAVLDSLVLYESALTSAESTLAIRRAALAQTRVQVGATEAELRAQSRGAESTLAAAERELARASSLFDRGATTQAIREDAERAVDAARADLDRLVASLTRYQPGPDGQQVDIAVATADLGAAEAAVEQARRDLDRARVLAPRGGTIIEVAARDGERPPADGLLRMGDTARMEAELEVFQTMVPRVAVGQLVSLVSGVLGDDPLTGAVSRVSTLVGRQSVTADDPAANTDARVLTVTVALDEASSARAARYVNLEVVARIVVAPDTPGEGAGQ